MSLFPGHEDWKEDDYWFTKTKKDIVSSIGKSRVRGGDEEEEPSKVAVVRDRDVYNREYMPDLVHINRDLLKSNLSDVYQRRVAINMTFAADGRPGEIKYLNMKSMAYNPAGNSIDGDWKDVKTAKKKPTSFCTDAEYWECCALDSLGDFWNAGNGLIRNRNSSGHIGYLDYFVLPICAKHGDSWTSTMVTNTLRNDLVESIRSCVSGKSLRYGATTLLNDHPNITEPELFARTGHARSENTKYYIISNRGLQFAPMRALAGYACVR